MNKITQSRAEDIALQFIRYKVVKYGFGVRKSDLNDITKATESLGFGREKAVAFFRELVTLAAASTANLGFSAFQLNAPVEDRVVGGKIALVYLRQSTIEDGGVELRRELKNALNKFAEVSKIPVDDVREFYAANILAPLVDHICA